MTEPFGRRTAEPDGHKAKTAHPSSETVCAGNHLRSRPAARACSTQRAEPHDQMGRLGARRLESVAGSLLSCTGHSVMHCSPLCQAVQRKSPQSAGVVVAVSSASGVGSGRSRPGPVFAVAPWSSRPPGTASDIAPRGVARSRPGGTSSPGVQTDLPGGAWLRRPTRPTNRMPLRSTSGAAAPACRRTRSTRCGLDRHPRCLGSLHGSVPSWSCRHASRR